MDKQMIENEFRQIRQSALQTSINILSLRLALVDKGIVTKEELEEYDKTAEKTMNLLMLQEREKMEAIIRQEFGDEAAEEIKKELEKALNQ